MLYRKLPCRFVQPDGIWCSVSYTARMTDGQRDSVNDIWMFASSH